MRTFPDLRFRELLSMLEQIRDGFSEVGPAVTLDRVVALRERAASLGVRSAHVAWMEGFVLEQLGRIEGAFQAVAESARLDPLSNEVQELFARLAWALRRELADPARDPRDPSTPRIYGLLQDAGEGDVPCHLAMARHLEATGQRDRAVRLVEAVLLVAPACKEAWADRALLAGAVGDEAGRDACLGELAALTARRPPFDVPGASEQARPCPSVT